MLQKFGSLDDIIEGFKDLIISRNLGKMVGQLPNLEELEITVQDDSVELELLEEFETVKFSEMEHTPPLLFLDEFNHVNLYNSLNFEAY
jgi:hypothetical protein